LKWNNPDFIVRIPFSVGNFHSPDVLEVGLGMLRKIRVDGKRDRDKSEVPCPVQMKDYCETFHLIDKVIIAVVAPEIHLPSLQSRASTIPVVRRSPQGIVVLGLVAGNKSSCLPCCNPEIPRD
jgi:hypothetical protein